MRLSLGLAFTIAAVAAAAACPSPTPEPAPEPAARPVVDSSRIRDSIANAERTRRDAEARVERDRIARDSAANLDRLRREGDEVRTMLITRIHFDYDKAEVRGGEDTQVLDQKVAILQRNPTLAIQITGHADERGSDEYNLALGNRRALSVKKYMTDRGIVPDRIATTSMGEEQPADPGSNEGAWAANRRADFSITRGGEALHRPSGM